MSTALRSAASYTIGLVVLFSGARAEAKECTNLLVPVCFSATHVAYSTLRMEPQYMIFGQAAGVAAAMAIREKVAVQDIDAAQLKRTLVEHGAILQYQETAQGALVARFKGKWPPQ